ncbi:MAG TPA: chemotaxis response regulator protein-glutamate methylesterase [Chloroflexi bacterium]|nr:chemotaxis response regulator protein-glutamate methylesterase [Chloroflexota bacterium]
MQARVSEPIRVLVVDDSAFIRFTLTRRLNQEPDIEVVGAAADGQEALKQIEALDPDVVTLDIEMPNMNGLQALRHIMAEMPRPVIMLSTLTQAGARETLQALALGATDFIPKPTNAIHVQHVLDDLKTKVRSYARLPMARMRADIRPTHNRRQTERAAVRPFTEHDVLVAIGSSTGGPRALEQVLSRLPAHLPAAFVIVQHMPPIFTASLAERLNRVGPLHVKEAGRSDRLSVGMALLARGGLHLCLQQDGSIRLSDAPPRNHVRPAVDVTFEHAARWFGPASVAVILTGMGSDGTVGARRIKARGGMVLAEAEESCVVYGMPKSAIEAGIVDRIASIDQMPVAVSEAVDHVAQTLR